MKTYVVGTQKNRLNEHPKHMFKFMGKKMIKNFKLKNPYMDLCGTTQTSLLSYKNYCNDDLNVATITIMYVLF